MPTIQCLVSRERTGKCLKYQHNNTGFNVSKCIVFNSGLNVITLYSFEETSLYLLLNVSLYRD